MTPPINRVLQKALEYRQIRYWLSYFGEIHENSNDQSASEEFLAVMASSISSS